MNTQQKEFVRFIKLLDDNDCLQDVVVVGSWAEFLYREAGLLQGFEPNIRTLDIDFLIKNLRRPVPEKNLGKLARDAGYIVESDFLDGTTKILEKSGLEIEFLINKIGAGLETTLKSNLGVTAQSLRHLNILASNIVEVSYVGMKISVPVPEAYATHKMVINHDRGRKQEKDTQAILNLWPFLDKEKLGAILARLTKNEQKAARVFMETHGLEI